VSNLSSVPRSAGQGWAPTMEKWLCWSSIGVAGLMLLLFLLDIFLGFPFGGLSTAVDVFGILASGLVLFLGWDALRDLR
jgi:hypothetical protein